MTDKASCQQDLNFSLGGMEWDAATNIPLVNPVRIFLSGREPSVDMCRTEWNCLYLWVLLVDVTTYRRKIYFRGEGLA